MEADLLATGFVWSDVPGRVTWRALLVMVKHSRPGSAMYLAASDEDTQWPRQEQLTAFLIDAINDLGWIYQSANSKSKVPRPPRFPRPGVVPVSDPDAQHYGSDPIRADEFASWWAEGWQDELTD